jgi:ATPase family associated with various cellular activities (AAA)
MTDWQDANKADLMQHVARMREGLSRFVAAAKDGKRSDVRVAPAPHPATPRHAVDTLAAAFGLSPFERDIVVLCAAIELDSAVAAMCREANGASPTFSLVLAALDGAHWSALTPAAPLRRWRLIDVAPGELLTASRLQIDERVLHYLTGVSYLDARLQWLTEITASDRTPAPVHAQTAAKIAEVWRSTPPAQPLPVIQLCGDEGVPSRRAVAARACGAAGMRLFLLDGNDVPQTIGEREAFSRLWEREAVLTRAVLLIETDDVETKRPLTALIESLGATLILSAREPRRILTRPTLRFDVGRPPFAQQVALWRTALGPTAEELDGAVEWLASQFTLEPDAIDTAIAQARATEDRDLARALWRTCRAQARTRIDELAQRIEPAASWDDLVLAGPQKETLRAMTAQVKRRSLVYEDWGFAAKSTRGLGISALFHGPSGTGKTMAAEVLARELELDLYRIDLSQVVNKYIGETEKNLRRVFDAADASGAILLFDEADTLFGKRSEVRDSHDRYANIEVGYLLQRMESYRGLAILTTNLKNVLDPSFLRRIRFAVQFPFPDAGQRAEIWRRVFPSLAPTEGLDAERLARLNVAGGNIRNIALQAAFLAAAEGQPVRMQHIAHAAHIEYAKLEKPPGEIGALA